MNGKIALASIFAISVLASGPALADSTTFKLFFDKGRASLSPEGDDVLGQAVQFSAASGSTQIDVIGHYDSAEPDGNPALGAARAQTVSDALRKDGLPASVNISISAATPNPTGKSGDVQNRLVEVVLR